MARTVAARSRAAIGKGEDSVIEHQYMRRAKSLAHHWQRYIKNGWDFDTAQMDGDIINRYFSTNDDLFRGIKFRDGSIMQIKCNTSLIVPIRCWTEEDWGLLATRGY
jgi:hypothetical protein